MSANFKTTEQSALLGVSEGYPLEGKMRLCKCGKICKNKFTLWWHLNFSYRHDSSYEWMFDVIDEMDNDKAEIRRT